MSDNIPAIIDRASQRLILARDSAEVLEAKAMAEAALHYARVTKAANETHADCLRIITRAEIRMANELDRGRANGEVAGHGGDRGKSRSPGLDDLGVSSQRASEWRTVRDAGEEVVETAISRALAEGRAPTKSEILEAAKQLKGPVRGTSGTGDNQWFTPPEWLDLAREVMGGIDLDPATHLEAQRIVKATAFFTEEDDGLQKMWNGRVWLNPPYSQPLIENFIDKLISEISCGNVSQAVLLTHNYSDTSWYQKAGAASDSFCAPRGRIRFVSPDGELASPTQGQTIFYFGDNEISFKEVFSLKGLVGNYE